MEREYSTKYIESLAIESGFFNSNETGDRTYDAENIGSMFEGLILDGVFNSVGQLFSVEANAGMIINVNPGRAWFNNTWITVNSTISGEISESTQFLDRIDAVVIEINKATIDIDSESKDRGRNGHIVILTGLASDNPQKPTLLHTGEIEQYALAYITVRANTDIITQGVIENVVGTEETPFVTGLLEHVDISELLQQYSSEAQSQMTSDKAAFDSWFGNLRNELDEHQAANLQNQINYIMEWINNIGNAEDEEY